ncbi:MAG: Calx-beta domain-containing protein, partial [Cyanobacteria bacterium P01_A01_bin.17]
IAEDHFINIDTFESEAVLGETAELAQMDAAKPGLALATGSSEPSLIVSDRIVPEGADSALVSVRLSSPSDQPIRVSWSTRYGNAVSSKDFQSKSGRITFAPGTTLQQIRVPLIDDNIDEPDQFFQIFFRNPSGVNIDDASAKITIRDNDPEPTIRFQDSLQSVIEGTGTETTFTNIGIQLSHRSEKNIRLTTYTAQNTASELEFLPKAERILFDAPGVLFNYRVGIVADDDLEGRQQFYQYLRNPLNARLDLSGSIIPQTDRIRTKIQILDDDTLTPQPEIDSSSSFIWGGTFGRTFTETELDTIAENSDFVVLAKFHASFSIDAHHAEAAALRKRKPEITILPYFNAKFWFVESDWGTAPDPDWLLRDEEGKQIVFDTDRSAANYFDLRIPAAREWILDTIESWMETGLYNGIAFDSVGPVGDVGEGTFWQDTLGGQGEVDRWNEGLATLLQEAGRRPTIESVIYNGIGESPLRGEDRDLFQLDYTDGALNERFAVDLSGQPNETLIDDINLLRDTDDRIFLVKSNVRDSGQDSINERVGRFSYGSFLLGWTPCQSLFKFAVDDFYTTSELEDYPLPRQVETGQPLGDYFTDGDLLIRDFEAFRVVVNLSDRVVGHTFGNETTDVPAQDALFLPREEA